MSTKTNATFVANRIADMIDGTAPGSVWPFCREMMPEHPAVVRAVACVDAAERTAVALVARDLEGLIGREIERRRGEAAVSMLAKVLGLVTRPSADEYRTEYKTEWRVGSHSDGVGVYLYADAAGANLALNAPEPEGPRFPFPGKREGDVFLLHDADDPEQPLDVYASADGLIVLVDHRCTFRWSVGDVKVARSAAPRHDAWRKWTAALDAHLAGPR